MTARKASRWSLSVPLLLLASACATPGGPPISKIADEINATLVPLDVVLAPGDKLEIRFPYAPEWTHQVQIRPDGKCSFLGVATLEVAGLYPEQLDERLTALYETILPKPDLTVELTSQAARMVTVVGEVGDPGPVEFPPDRRLTLVEAIGHAGGHNKGVAYLASTVLVRWDAANQRQQAWTIDMRVQNWTSPKVILLQPYDLVYVPNKPIDNVAIWIQMYIVNLIPFPRSIVPI